MNQKHFYAIDSRHLVVPQMEEPQTGICQGNNLCECDECKAVLVWLDHIESLPAIEIEGPDIVPGTRYREDEFKLEGQVFVEGKWHNVGLKYFDSRDVVKRIIAIPVASVQQEEDEAYAEAWKRYAVSEHERNIWADGYKTAMQKFKSND